MSDVVEERRVFLFPDGEEGELFVSREGPGVYRVQEVLGLALYGGVDLPEEAGLGWLLDVEELPDGRLRVQRIREDPTVESIIGVVLPRGFSQSAEFRGLGDKIVAGGGNWVLFAHGLFSAYVKKDRRGRPVLDVSAELQEAIERWSRPDAPPQQHTGKPQPRDASQVAINADADPRNADWIKYVTGRRILEGVETRAELERELQAEGMTIETFMLNPFFDEFVQEWPWLKELKIADDES